MSLSDGAWAALAVVIGGLLAILGGALAEYLKTRWSQSSEAKTRRRELLFAAQDAIAAAIAPYLDWVPRPPENDAQRRSKVMDMHIAEYKAEQVLTRVGDEDLKTAFRTLIKGLHAIPKGADGSDTPVSDILETAYGNHAMVIENRVAALLKGLD